MKIVICGGHLTPALSLIEVLPKDAEVIYVGRKNAIEGDKGLSLEYQTITEKNIEFVEIKTGRLQRKFTRHFIPSISKVPYGFASALLLLKKYKPDVVVGFGGYVSFPIALAAKSLKIPVVIHEQTLEAGFANKIIGKFANKICISFPSSERYFPESKTVLTGNPIRKSILSPVKNFDVPVKEKVIYITGGSQGSHFINSMVQENIVKMLEDYVVIHQVGDSQKFNDYENLLKIKSELPEEKRKKYFIFKHLTPDEVGGILKTADLVIARSGINTVSELIVLKKPSFLIPLPISQKNEQLRNAKYLKDLGLGEIELQKDLNPERFYEKIKLMMENYSDYKITNEKDNFPKDAAEKIKEVVYASAKSHH